ncbi:glycosyltransferase [Akkermansiaceae bacterium]|nr:glycosyltransferase [Akkermansiaceae bacterium]
MKNKIGVSIIITTFNQEMYVEKAVQSALNQKTDFYYEILIGDDFSTDNTKEICSRYAQKYPDIVILEPRSKNIGLIDNYADLIKKAKGKYIAILEGDDLWIDLYKLQKQYNFLESNNCGLVFSNCQLLDNETGKTILKYPTPINRQLGAIYNNLIRENFITAVTVVFKRDLIIQHLKDDLEEIRKFKTIDYYIILLIAKHSKIGYIEDITSVYRIHNNSISNNKSLEARLKFLQSTLEIKIFFLKKFRGNENLFKLIYSRHYYDLFIVFLLFEETNSSISNINLDKNNNLLLTLYFRNRVIRRIIRALYSIYKIFKIHRKY